MVIGIAVLFVALQAYPFFLRSELGSITTSWNATLLWGLLRLAGANAILDGTVILTDTIHFVVIPECTIFAPLALFSAGVLVFPSNISTKLRALMLGILVLSVANLARLVTLYIVLIVSPQLFEPVHLFVWQPIMAITALALWAMWAARQARYA